jgi:thiamine-phosphate pyrophosphorylase
MKQWSWASRLYFVTDEHIADGRSLPDLVRLVASNGVGLVQYRAKARPTSEMIDEASELVGICRAAGVPLVVNDRVDVALAATADGVHVGAEDCPAAIARRLLGPNAIVGVTVDSVADAREAQRQGATYVALASIFPSPTKPELPVVGVEGLAEIAAATPLPVCAIGGITRDNVLQLRNYRCELVAVVSAITAAPDPAAATRELVRLLS